MNKQPNPTLRNTVIYVGNDETLRKKAIEYYEKNGYPFEKESGLKHDYYIATFSTNECVSDFSKRAINKSFHTIITLPTETESEYPRMMTLVGCDGLDFIDVVQGVFLGKYMVKDPNDEKMFHAFDVAKPLPTTTLTVAELVEFYEKSNNVKVEVK